jgi:hypothetical protein
MFDLGAPMFVDEDVVTLQIAMYDRWRHAYVFVVCCLCQWKSQL